MAHGLVAALWEQLRKYDLADLLHELVGQHTLDLSAVQQAGAFPDLDASIRTVAWIKTFFDLQRAYLQGNASSGRCDPLVVPHLLPSELVYSTIMFLIQLKTSILPSHTATIGDFSKQRLTFLETILSGIRVILLRREPFTALQKHKLVQALQSAWTHGRLSNLERCLIFGILPEGIDQIPTSNSVASPMSAFDVRLPPWSSGPKILSINYATFVSDTLEGLDTEDSNRILAFWALYDVLWTTEACIIRTYANNRNRDSFTNMQFPTSGAQQNPDGRQTIIEQPKKSLLSALASSKSPPIPSNVVTLIDIIKSTLIVRVDETAIESPRDQENTLRSSQRATETSIKDFLSWVTSRGNRKRISGGEWKAVCLDLEFSLKEWVYSTTVIHNETHDELDPSEESTLYVVNCPALHPIPKYLLRKTLDGVDKMGLKDLSSGTPFVMFRACCPLCPTDTKIQCGRKLEPLERVSKALRERTESEEDNDDGLDSGISPRPPSRPKYESRSPSNSGRSSTPTSISSLHADQVSPSRTAVIDFGTTLNLLDSTIKTPPVTKAGTLAHAASSQSLSWFLSSGKSKMAVENMGRPNPTLRSPLSQKATAKCKSRPPVSLPGEPRFCFSSKGNALLLWGKQSQWLLKHKVDLKGGLKQTLGYKVADVQAAASGGSHCAVISGEQGNKKLVTFQDTSPYPDASLSIEDSTKPSAKTSLVVSRDDKFAAFIWNDQVRVYGVGHKNIRRIDWPGQMEVYQLPGHTASGAHQKFDSPIFNSKQAVSLQDVEQEAKRQGAVVERRVNFSADSSKIIVATHLANYYVHLDVWDCRAEPFTISPDFSRSLKLPPWSPNDGDLTGIFYDDLLQSTFLTAFRSKEMPNRISLPGYDSESKTFLIKVVHAAQSPAGSRFAITNSMNETWVLEYRHKGLSTNRRLKKTTSKIPSMTFKPDQIAIAMPTENTLLTCWTKDSTPILRTTEIGEKEVVKDQDLRSEFERALRELDAKDAEQSGLFSPLTLEMPAIEPPKKPQPLTEISGDRTPLELAATESKYWFTNR